MTRWVRTIGSAWIALALCSCAAYFFPGPATSPQEFSPGVWETGNGSYRVDLRPDGTGEIIGYGWGIGWVCWAPERAIDDPGTPRVEVTWESPRGGELWVNLDREELPNLSFTLEADSEQPGYWGAMWIYPCDDPDLGYALLIKVKDY